MNCILQFVVFTACTMGCIITKEIKKICTPAYDSFDSSIVRLKSCIFAAAK